MLALLLVLCLYTPCIGQMNAPLNVDSAVLFSVNAGDNMNRLSHRIKQNQWLKNRFWLRTFVRLNPKFAEIKQGTYLVKPGDSTMDLLKNHC